ncbi:GNAT family N-acetyltransferase [Micromonospora sp. NPDC050276]|uniref:GNAT family N-acetyltransferase n=1 Tax=Micromonospora sp. NPDC050276 TaxID=3364278 RepID=UPI00379F1771
MLKYWPVSSLRVRTPELELRWPTLEDLDALADRGVEGVHDPAYMPFFSQWTDGEPATVARRVLQRTWAALGAWSPEDWTLYLAVVHNGTVIGCQSVGARNFGITREVVLTSWSGRRFQGKGLGLQARAALLELCFAGLGAREAVVVVRQDNTASQAVCRKFGFVARGVQVNAVRGERVFSDRYHLDRGTWEQHRTITAEIVGIEDSLEMFGAGDRPPVGASAVRHAVTAATMSGVQNLGEADHAPS